MQFLPFLFVIFPIFESQYVCPIHKEDIKNGIDASIKYPGFVALENDCESCWTQTNAEKSIVQYECHRKRSQSVYDKYIKPKICANVTDGEIICVLGECCCRRDDCFDKIRNELATKKSVRNVSCNVTVLDGMSYMADRILRTTCGTCMATKKEFGIESICVEDSDVTEQCGQKTYFKGENLACNVEGTSCCCAAPNCEAQFLALFYEGKQLKSTKIRMPYVTQTAISTTFSSSIFFIFLLFT